VKAIDVTELYRWPDVVIISTQGSHSLASLLAGGMLTLLAGDYFNLGKIWLK